MAKGIYIGVMKTLSSLPIGSLVKDPNSTFLGKPVIWKIADKNHEGYPSNSVTLISERILALRCFDAKEPNNSNSNRKSYGNNRYSVSNIRQWLNSDAGTGQWYSAQHSADTPPNSSNVMVLNNVSVNPYDTKVGFLNGFSDNFKNALLETTLTVALNTATDGGGSETVVDKIFLASQTEVGVQDSAKITEGTLLSIFTNDASRVAYVTAEGRADSNYSSTPSSDTQAYGWGLRTPANIANPYTVGTIAPAGYSYNINAYSGGMGVRPLCNLTSSLKVSATTDSDGCYTLFLDGGSVAHKVKKAYVGVDGKARKVKKGYIGVGGVAKLFYNPPTIFTSNPAPTGFSGGLTSGTDGNEWGTWTITADVQNSGYYPKDAFDGDTGTHFTASSIGTSSGTRSITLNCPSGVYIKPSHIKFIGARLGTVTFTGVTESDARVTFGTKTGSTTSNETMNIYPTTDQWFKSFRVETTRYSSSYKQPWFTEFQIVSGEIRKDYYGI